MGKKILFLFIVLFIYMFGTTGCSEADKNDVSDSSQIRVESLKERDVNVSPQLSYVSSMELRYAERFAVDYYKDGYCLLSLADGNRILLVPENAETPAELDKDIIVLQQPVNQLYLVATAAMDMFCELDALEHIRFSGQKAEGWYIDEAREAVENGEMLYAGKYSMPDYELILSEGCSMAIENTMITHSPEVIEKLEEFGIPVMIDYSSYEKHPLGRVEWVKFYGALLGKEDKAMELFQMQEEMLECISSTEETEQTVAFFYIATNGTVNVRKTSDYVPKMIKLAGGVYIFDDLGSDLDNKSSLNITMEEFYAAAKDADYLIYNSVNEGELQTIEELLGKSELLKDFKAVEEGNVWCTTSDMYQKSMSIGYFIEDIHTMLSDDSDKEDYMQYLYLLD